MTIEELEREALDVKEEDDEESEDKDVEGQLLEAMTLLNEVGDALKEARKHILKLDKTTRSKVVAADLASLSADVEMFIESVE